MDRAGCVCLEFLGGEESLARCAVEPFVAAAPQSVATLEAPIEESRGPDVCGIGGAEESIRLDVEGFPGSTEDLCVSIGEFLWGEALMFRSPLNMDSVFIGAGLKEDLSPGIPMKPSHRVGRQRAGRVTEVRLPVDVVDRGGQDDVELGIPKRVSFRCRERTTAARQKRKTPTGRSDRGASKWLGAAATRPRLPAGEAPAASSAWSCG